MEVTDSNMTICQSGFTTFLRNSKPIVLYLSKFSKTLVKKGDRAAEISEIESRAERLGSFPRDQEVT